MTASGIAGINRKNCDEGEVAVGATVIVWKASNIQYRYII